jgi:hypothetical protein
MALSDRCQLDEIAGQGEQTQLSAYFFQVFVFGSLAQPLVQLIHFFFHRWLSISASSPTSG